MLHAMGVCSTDNGATELLMPYSLDDGFVLNISVARSCMQSTAVPPVEAGLLKQTVSTNASLRDQPMIFRGYRRRAFGCLAL